MNCYAILLGGTEQFWLTASPWHATTDNVGATLISGGKASEMSDFVLFIFAALAMAAIGG